MTIPLKNIGYEGAHVKQSETELHENTPLVAAPSEGTAPDVQISAAQDETSGTMILLGSALLADEAALQSRRGFSLPNRAQLLNWLPFVGVILLGAVLRFWGLGDKPLHHDESLHAYYSLQLLQNTIWQWKSCVVGTDPTCYSYSPWLHGPFQFHAIALVYQISRWLGAPDNGVNTTTVRIAAATLGTVLVGLPYFLRDYLGRLGAWLACFLLAISPSMVYFSRFAREDIYMACFTLLLVVATARYIRERKMRWLVLAAIGFTLSYATKEATFLTVAIFGSFLGALIVWEIGTKIPLRARLANSHAARFVPRTYASLSLLVYFMVVGIAAKWLFAKLHTLSIYITDPKNLFTSDTFVTNLKQTTIRLMPWLGIVLGLFVFSILAREMYGKVKPQGRRGLARFVDRRQPVLDSILSIPWTHWFFALIVGWAIFLLLFTALFTNVANGIGDGIWQGLYYWLQQQQVDRGGQPWYYYLLLIPLYEQIGVVFGLAGIVRALLKPTRFRLFLVYWLFGNLFIYSWAAEKMPWLSIHIVVPMLLLAALGLEPCVMACSRFVRDFWAKREAAQVLAASARPRKVSVRTGVAACLGCLCAVLLFLPTLQNMYQVSYVHAADSQHEMLVYVQTTVYVNTVMEKITAVDQKVDGGKHQVRIGVMAGVWAPFEWYLRDYPNVCFGYPTSCQDWVGKTPIIIAGDGDNLSNLEQQLHADYQSQAYVMRGQFDQGYMPPPCVPKPQSSCPDQPYWGIGPGAWLSYGDNPPPGAGFNPVLAMQHIWRWWWQRVPFAHTYGGDGGYHMELFLQKGLGVNP